MKNQNVNPFLLLTVAVISLFIISCQKPVTPPSSTKGITVEGVSFENNKLVAQKGFSWKKDFLLSPSGDSIATVMLVNERNPKIVLAYALCGCGGYPFGPNTCEGIKAQNETWCFGDCGNQINAPNCGGWILFRFPNN